MFFFDPVVWRNQLSLKEQGAHTEDSGQVVETTLKEQTNDAPVNTATPAFKETASTTEGAMVVVQKKSNNEKAVDPMLSNKLAAFYVLENWKLSWENQDIEEYLKTYSPHFSPTGNAPIDVWKKKRKGSLTRPAYIHINIDNPVVEMLTDEQLLITFKQGYQSNTYKDCNQRFTFQPKSSEYFPLFSSL